MMMQFHHKRKPVHGKGIRVVIATCFVGLFFLIDAVTSGSLRGAVRVALAPFSDFIAATISIPFGNYLQSKAALSAENELLRDALSLMRQSQFVDDITRTDLSRFCASTQGVPTISFKNIHPHAHIEPIALARVTGAERVFFGTLTVAFTDERRPGTHAIALDEAGVPLGRLTEVYGTRGVVALFSAAQVKTEVRIGTTRTVMTGRGGSTMVAHVPQETKVAVGDIVVLTELGLSLGEVAEVISNPADPEMTLFIRPLGTAVTSVFVSFINAQIPSHE